MVNCIANIFHMEKEDERRMITKLFKFSTRQLVIIPNKKLLVQFVKQETSLVPSRYLTTDQMIACLPVENFHRIK